MDFKKPLNMYQGLAIIGVQIVASKLFFHEAISPTYGPEER
jgi:hypothetical protein